jgi:hypothetical protein
MIYFEALEPGAFGTVSKFNCAPTHLGMERNAFLERQRDTQVIDGSIFCIREGSPDADGVAVSVEGQAVDAPRGRRSSW